MHAPPPTPPLSLSLCLERKSNLENELIMAAYKENNSMSKIGWGYLPWWGEAHGFRALANWSN